MTQAAKETVRIAALGDLHHSRTAHRGALQPLFAQINEAADVLVLCGDLTDYGLARRSAVPGPRDGSAQDPGGYGARQP